MQLKEVTLMSTPSLGNLINGDRIALSGRRFVRNEDGDFIDGEGNPSSNQVGGRVQIGGSLLGNSASFGSELSGQAGTTGLSVNGNIEGGPKNINNGVNVEVGGDVLTNLNLNGGGQLIQSNDLDLEDEQALALIL